MPKTYPKSRNFLILGCHRTGTTLLRLITDSHTEIRCHDERYGYRLYTTRSGRLRDILGAMHGLYPETPSEDEEEPWIEGFKLPSWTELFVEYEEIARSYQGERILFMMRDVKDTIASMQRLTGGKFLRNGVVGSLNHWAENDDDRHILQSLLPELEKIKQQSHPLLRQAALYWKYKTQIYFNLIDAGHPVLPVIYKKLVSAPVIECQRICEFLDVDWQPRMLSHHDLDHTGVDMSGITVGFTDAKKAIHRESVGKWKEELRGQGRIHAIMEVAGELNNKVMNLY